MTGHVVPRRTYYAIFCALMILTFLTVQAAVHDLGAFNTPIAMAIACTKATLVVLYFMHARHSNRLVWIVFGIGVLWLLVLIFVTLSDYLSR